MRSIEWRAIFNDLGWPLTTLNHPIFTFSVIFP